jgi:DNA-binding CsgD family transcriptional regulator
VFSATARQQEIVRLIASGLSDKEIAGRLDVSVATVRTHLRRLYLVNGLQGRAHAAALYALTLVPDEERRLITDRHESVL